MGTRAVVARARTPAHGHGVGWPGHVRAPQRTDLQDALRAVRGEEEVLGLEVAVNEVVGAQEVQAGRWIWKSNSRAVVRTHVMFMYAAQQQQRQRVSRGATKQHSTMPCLSPPHAHGSTQTRSRRHSHAPSWRMRFRARASGKGPFLRMRRDRSPPPQYSKMR